MNDLASTGDVTATAAVERTVTALIHRAARLADEQDYRAWVKLFTDDAVYAAITRENLQSQGLYLYYDEGIHAIKERAAYLEGGWQVPRGRTLHAVSNIDFLEASDSAASVLSYFVIYRTGDREHSKLHACGEYRDAFVRVERQWLFRSRIAVVDSQVLPPAFTELL
jgi:3-phenylpropionate/cinnamic acid dioxygenase small subunit